MSFRQFLRQFLQTCFCTCISYRFSWDAPGDVRDQSMLHIKITLYSILNVEYVISHFVTLAFHNINTEDRLIHLIPNSSIHFTMQNILLYCLIKIQRVLFNYKHETAFKSHKLQIAMPELEL